MPGMQRPHGRHERDRIAAAARHCASARGERRQGADHARPPMLRCLRELLVMVALPRKHTLRAFGMRRVVND